MNSINLLFISHNDTSPQRGGIGSITNCLNEYFAKTYHYSSYLAYYHDIPSSFQKTYFVDRYKLAKGSEEACLEGIIKQNHIHIVLVQQCAEVISCLSRILHKNHIEDCKIIYVQHDFLSKNQIYSLKNYLKFSASNGSLFSRLRSLVKLFVFPLYYIHYEKQISGVIKEACDLADSVVVLSEFFLPYGLKFIGESNKSKVAVIGNCLTLPYFLSEECIVRKKCEVLIVSRLEEGRKRLSVAIKIWELIEKSNQCNDWILRIVGSGKEEAFYHQMIRALGLKNIHIEGSKESVISYYEKASIFMMTSDMEGWGLTLTESLQMGVVPFVFDSFESLHNILQDKYNGCIISNGNIKEYSERMIALMLDHKQRERMSRNCIASSHAFSVDKVADKWINLFEKMLV